MDENSPTAERNEILLLSNCYRPPVQDLDKHFGDLHLRESTLETCLPLPWKRKVGPPPQSLGNSSQCSQLQSIMSQVTRCVGECMVRFSTYH